MKALPLSLALLMASMLSVAAEPATPAKGPAVGVPITAKDAHADAKMHKMKMTPPAKGGLRIKPKDGYMCYVGPCENGMREVCYYSDEDGCTDCFESSEGCD